MILKNDQYRDLRKIIILLQIGLEIEHFKYIFSNKNLLIRFYLHMNINQILLNKIDFPLAAINK